MRKQQIRNMTIVEIEAVMDRQSHTIANQRSELRRLNRKLTNVVAASRAQELGHVSKAELQHEINKLARRAHVAESDNERLRVQKSEAAAE